ncbi:MAG: type II toxin-antitoxin system VapC family toxin [Candidatus Dormibacteraceae bacterium]
MSAGSPIVVIDAAALVALVADRGDAGSWVTDTIAGAGLAAPQLAPFEAGNILRRQAAAALLQPAEAKLAYDDLLALPLRLVPFVALAERAWQLRPNLTIYDATYVALAEALGVPMVTLDARLARAAGPRCTIRAYAAPDSRAR